MNPFHLPYDVHITKPAHCLKLCIAILGMVTIAACGGGGGGSSSGGGGGSGGGNTRNDDFANGRFSPYANFEQMCANPRSGAGFNDRTGSITDEKNWIRAWTNDTYLWYSEVTDRDPVNAQETPLEYFKEMKTTREVRPGKPVDEFHFTWPTDEWQAQLEQTEEIGYGMNVDIVEEPPPREAIVVSVVQGSPAAHAGVRRGDLFVEVDGVDFVNGGTQADVDTINGALIGLTAGETHTFVLRHVTGGADRRVTMTAAVVNVDPVQAVDSIETDTAMVGYLQLDTFSSYSVEKRLFDAVTQLEAAQVTELVLDLRYNSGGLLDAASQLSYMIAGERPTDGQIFERLIFNDKLTSQQRETPFYTETRGLDEDLIGAGVPLPTLDLNRVFILTGASTCSASEAVINGLRGVNIEVIQIGERTCGKPYGFFPTDNCGTTYFTVQFRGENGAGFGEYADGFIPQNHSSSYGVSLPGCQVSDDLTRSLGDPQEARLRAAINYLETGGNCPAVTLGAGVQIAASARADRPTRGLAITHERPIPGRIVTMPR